MALSLEVRTDAEAHERDPDEHLEDNVEPHRSVREKDAAVPAKCERAGSVLCMRGIEEDSI